MKRWRGIEKDPEFQRAYAEALGSEKFARLWLPALGRWDVRVERFFLAGGMVLAAIAMVVVLIVFGARPSAAAIVAVPVLVALTGWSLARWLGGANYPTEHLAGGIRTVIIWLVIAWCARRALLLVLPDLSALGFVERAFLAPFVIAVVVVLGARLRLSWWVTGFAAFLIAMSVAGIEGPSAEREAYWATPAQMRDASRSGATLLLGPGGGEYLPTTDSLQAPRRAVRQPPAGASCRWVRGKDVRRTVLGLRARTIAFRAEVCWDASGRPVSAVFDGAYSRGTAAGQVRPVRLENLDAFTAPFQINASGLRYGAGESYAGVRVDLHDTFNPVTMRVSRDGHTVWLAEAFETRDPLVHGASVQDERHDGSTADGADGPFAVDRLFSLRTRNGYAIEVIAIQADFNATARATVLRSTANGSRMIASYQGPASG